MSLSVLKQFSKVALQALRPEAMVSDAVQLRGSALTIAGQRYDLRKHPHIYVVGAGKATLAMAKQLHAILGKQITAGYINVPVTKQKRVGKIMVQSTSHPFPNQATVAASKRIFQLVQSASADDLILCLISGGGSSMLTLPRPGMNLTTKKQLTKKLMHRGADITALNTVRKHLSQVKGGQLAASTTASIISLIISDVIGDPLDVVASGLTVADPSTSQHAVAILRKHGLYTPQLHKIMRAETPKHGLEHVRNVLIGSNNLAIEQLTIAALKRGIEPHILTTTLHGEASHVAIQLCEYAKQSRQQLKLPALLLAGGETTVTVRGKGYGGRNQELALMALPHLVPGVSLLALATDGVDGHTPKPVAGAIVTSQDYQRAKRLKLKIEPYLLRNDSYTALKKLGCLVQTGPTGTNVGDIVMILIQ